jgi:hypothetical protein
VFVKFVRSVGPIYAWRGVGMSMLLLFMSMGWDYVSELRSPKVHPSDGYIYIYMCVCVCVCVCVWVSACTEPRWNDNINKRKDNNSEKMRKQELVSLVAAYKTRENTYPADSMLASFGNTVLRLSPYVYDSYWIGMGQSENTGTSQQHNGWIVSIVPHGSTEKCNCVCYKRRLGRLQ